MNTALKNWLLKHVRIAACTLLAAVPTAAHEAQDLLMEQDFHATPPQLVGAAADWVAWLGTGSYERSGAQPFAAPVPPGLPPDVTDIYMEIKRSAYVTTSGGVTCTERWTDTYVLLYFADGSHFSWWEIHMTQTCSDGSSEGWDDILATAGVDDPITGAWSGWVRSYKRDSLATQRRTSLRGAAGSKASLGSLAAVARPIVGLEHDAFDITFAPGGVLDLRGLDGTGGPLFETGGPMLLRCDTILMDPGVQLTDLFSVPPMPAPGAVVRELALSARPHAFFSSPGPATTRVLVSNLGNVTETAQLDWIDVLAWSFGGPIPQNLQPGEILVRETIPLSIPPAAAPGTTSTLTAQLSAPMLPPVAASQLLVRVPTPPAVGTHRAPLFGCAGCPPLTWTGGSPTLTGYDDFVLHAPHGSGSDAVLTIQRIAPSSTPFGDGTLRIRPREARAEGDDARGGRWIASRDGELAFHVTQEFLVSHGFAAGDRAHCRWWKRDPLAPSSAPLPEAVAFVVGP